MDRQHDDSRHDEGRLGAEGERYRRAHADRDAREFQLLAHTRRVREELGHRVQTAGTAAQDPRSRCCESCRDSVRSSRSPSSRRRRRPNGGSSTASTRPSDYYRSLVDAASRSRLSLANRNFDTGAPVKPGEYSLVDETFAELVQRLATQSNAAPIPPALLTDPRVLLRSCRANRNEEAPQGVEPAHSRPREDQGHAVTTIGSRANRRVVSVHLAERPGSTGLVCRRVRASDHRGRAAKRSTIIVICSTETAHHRVERVQKR